MRTKLRIPKKVLAVMCPFCRVGPGKRCQNKRALQIPHASRYYQAGLGWPQR